MQTVKRERPPTVLAAEEPFFRTSRRTGKAAVLRELCVRRSSDSPRKEPLPSFLLGARLRIPIEDAHFDPGALQPFLKNIQIRLPIVIGNHDLRMKRLHRFGGFLGGIV